MCVGGSEQGKERRYLDVLQLEILGHLGAAHHTEERLDDIRATVAAVVQLLHAPPHTRHQG